AGFSGPSVFAGQAIDLGAKLVEILEAAIHRGKAHEGHLVQLAQLQHHLFSDDAGWHFPLTRGAQMALDAIDRLVHLLDADRPLLERLQQTGVQLAFIEGLAVAVLLDDPGHHQFRRLVGGEALGTGDALAPTPDLIAFGDQPGVDYLGVQRATEWAVHYRLPAETRSDQRKTGKRA